MKDEMAWRSAQNGEENEERKKKIVRRGIEEMKWRQSNENNIAPAIGARMAHNMAHAHRPLCRHDVHRCMANNARHYRLTGGDAAQTAPETYAVHCKHIVV